MESEEHKFLQHYKRHTEVPTNDMKISILHRVNYSAKSPDKPPGITKEKLCQYLGLNRKQSNSDPVVSNIIKAKDKLKRRSLRVRYLEIVKKTQDKLVNAAPKPETSPTTVVDVPASLIRLDKKVELKKQEKEPQKFTGIERIDYCKKSPKPDNVIDLDSSNKIPTTPQYEMKILAGVVPPKCSILLRRYKSEDDKEVPSKIQKPNVPVMKSPENLVDNQQAESPIEPKSIKLEIMKFPRRLETQSPPKLILIPRPRPLNMVVAQKPAVQQLAPALSSLPKGQIQQLPHIKGLQGFIVKPNLPRTSSAPAEGILMKQEAKLIKQLPPIVQVQPNISSQSLRIEEKKVIEQKFQEKKIHELKLQEKKLQVEEMVIQQPPAPIHQAKDQPANINKINNKINIIIKMDPQDKRRLKFNQVRSRKKDPPSPIKSPQKHVKTQTDQVLHLPEPERKPEKPIKVEKLDLITNCSTNNFLSSEAVQKVFFEHDILVVVQKQLISYFRYDKMKFLLTGVTIFNPIDKMERKLYDEEINVENNERLCFSENNSQNPILIEMRGKQKVLEPNMCPLLSLYCNIYYLDQDKLLFSCVNLDTVKSLLQDICYITIPNTCYFLMSWSEPGLEKPPSTGLCKYNLTPNLQLAKLASIRQFPTIHYIVKHMNIANNYKLVVLGETELSIFNYNTGDLLISLDLGKNYGLNLTTFELPQNYLFMVKIANTDSNQEKDIHVTFIGGHSAHLKLIHSQRVQMGDFKIVTSTSVSQKQLICTFDNGSALILNLENFNDISIRDRPFKTRDRIFACSNNYLVVVRDRNVQLLNSQFYINGIN